MTSNRRKVSATNIPELFTGYIGASIMDVPDTSNMPHVLCIHMHDEPVITILNTVNGSYCVHVNFNDFTRTFMYRSQESIEYLLGIVKKVRSVKYVNMNCSLEGMKSTLKSLLTYKRAEKWRRLSKTVIDALEMYGL